MKDPFPLMCSFKCSCYSFVSFTEALNEEREKEQFHCSWGFKPLSSHSYNYEHLELASWYLVSVFSLSINLGRKSSGNMWWCLRPDIVETWKANRVNLSSLEKAEQPSENQQRRHKKREIVFLITMSSFFLFPCCYHSFRVPLRAGHVDGVSRKRPEPKARPKLWKDHGLPSDKPVIPWWVCFCILSISFEGKLVVLGFISSEQSSSDLPTQTCVGH